MPSGAIRLKWRANGKMRLLSIKSCSGSGPEETYSRS
jgi:hypothetical protein